MAFVCIQHLDPKHESLLTAILAKVTFMKVVEVTHGMPVRPNYVYVIPPNKCMTISEGVLKLAPRVPSQTNINRPIDVFLKSLAQERKSQAIAIILSGTASDGSAGIMSIKEEGGITFAQEEASAKFGEMPRNAIATGCIDFILSPQKIAENLTSLSRHPYSHASENQIDELLPETDEAFRQIVLLLKKASGVDFACYKPATIQRRVLRRMVLNRKESLQSYLDVLKKNPKELEALHQDVLIKVTRFFRDPEIFKSVQKVVYSHISKYKSKDTPIRIWVPACSTGEEVYSLAIVLLEHLGGEGNPVPIQFFGSDIKDSCIQEARAGIYSEVITQDVSAERLERFFTKVHNGYQIKKSIRERCIFAKQNVTADPPFSKVDFISCRNLLIYLTPALQKKVIPTFHYALNPGGFLLLGQSESILNFPDLFKCVHKKAKIYSKIQTRKLPAAARVSSPRVLEKYPVAKQIVQNEEARIAFSAQKEADRLVMAKYDEAGVLVNEDMEILQFRGDTSSYLRQAPGAPSLNLFKMAREGLLAELRTALSIVMKEGGSFKKENVRIKSDSGFKNISFEVIFIKVAGANQRYFLVSFSQASPRRAPPEAAKTKKPFKIKAGSRKSELEKEVAGLKDELICTKAYMQSIIEERERANADLQAGNEEIVTSNEELQSLNEEMQSANEELQTAKEELQASNEEITTINDELNGRNIQLAQLNDDFVNLTKSIKLPVVIVGKDMRIRFFTPAAEKLFSLVATDVGRSINDIKLRVTIGNFNELLSEVIQDATFKEQEVRNDSGHWYNLQIRPYKTSENKIEGAIIAFADIDVMKKNQSMVEEYAQYLSDVIQTISVPLLVLDSNLRVKMANKSFCRTFQVRPNETENRLVYELGNKQWDIPLLRKLLEDILPLRSKFENYEVEHKFENVGVKTMLLNGRQIDSAQVILLSIEDITEQKRMAKGLQELNAVLEAQGRKLESSNVELAQFAAVASHDPQEPFHIISSFMHLLSTSYKDKLEPKAQELIKISEDAAARAQNLISSLLDYARIDTGERRFERVDLKAVVRQVLLDIRVQIEESAAEITCDPLPTITGEPVHLARLFQNLISNAIKYRSERPLKIHIAARKEPAEWVFELKDNGMGFDPKHKERIFGMFNRLHDREISGVGIGLATCKKIVDHHSGRIWAESEPGRGTTFYFSIPHKRVHLNKD